jgi:hypothetical protein
MSKAVKDPRGGHIRVYWDLLDSMAWRALAWTDQGLFVAMRRQLRGSNNGDISATLTTMRHAGFTSPATLSKSLRALQTMGFIVKTRQGGIASGAKSCSLYRFTDEPTFDIPKHELKACKATNEWKQFKTLAQATAALDVAHLAAKRPRPKKRKAASDSEPG